MNHAVEIATAALEEAFAKAPKDGEAAYERGETLESNPHNPSTKQHGLWAEGWGNGAWEDARSNDLDPLTE
jgi:hypothetical protein